MSIFSTIFGGAQAPAAPAAQPAQNSGAGQPGNIPPQATQNTAQSQNTAPNGVVPEQGNQPQNAEPASQLDQFSQLWQPNENPNEPQPLIKVDPKSLAEAARKTDFTKMITPDQMQAIATGGEGAVQAFAAAMNQVAQGVYAQSAFAATKIVEQAVSKAQERFSAEIPNHVKKLQVSESLRGENPALNHPAASPILGAIESQLTMKHPNASSGEITKMAKQYLEQFASAVNAPAQQQQQQQQKKSQDFDWNSFLN